MFDVKEFVRTEPKVQDRHERDDGEPELRVLEVERDTETGPGRHAI